MAGDAREELEALIRAHGWSDRGNSGVGRCYCFTMDEPHCSFQVWAAHLADALTASGEPDDVQIALLVERGALEQVGWRNKRTNAFHPTGRELRQDQTLWVPVYRQVREEGT